MVWVFGLWVGGERDWGTMSFWASHRRTSDRASRIDLKGGKFVEILDRRSQNFLTGEIFASHDSVLLKIETRRPEVAMIGHAC